MVAPPPPPIVKSKNLRIKPTTPHFNTLAKKYIHNDDAIASSLCIYKLRQYKMFFPKHRLINLLINHKNYYIHRLGAIASSLCMCLSKDNCTKSSI